MSQYADDLKHPKWQQKRLQVLDKAGFRCERCGNEERTLRAHHKIYLRGRKPWEYEDNLLECVCEDCHDLAHAERERLEMEIAWHPTSVVPSVSRVVGSVALMLSAPEPQMRTDARNRVQDELDAMEDFFRWSCQ